MGRGCKSRTKKSLCEARIALLGLKEHVQVLSSPPVELRLSIKTQNRKNAALADTKHNTPATFGTGSTSLHFTFNLYFFGVGRNKSS